MKNIELAEEHKSKLLEMCNKLFWNGCINKCDFNELGILFIALDKNYKYNHKILKIHWFEFCVNNLCKKLYEKLDKRTRTYFLFNNAKGIVVYHKYSIFTNYYLYFEKEHHMVDYIYEVFKKLK